MARNKILLNLSQAAKTPLAAYSLIEMVVSLGIVALIASLFIANYHAANSRSDVVMAAQKLIADIHQAQNNSLGLVQYGTTTPAGGWGLHFITGSSTYVFFADT